MTHPLHAAIDAAIDAEIHARKNGAPVAAERVADNVIATVPAGLVLDEFRRSVIARVLLRTQEHRAHEGGETS